jgi:hypothetical protein
VKSDEHGKHPTADEYRKWGSVRAQVIMWIAVVLIIGGVIAYLIVTGHPAPGGGPRY